MLNAKNIFKAMVSIGERVERSTLNSIVFVRQTIAHAIKFFETSTNSYKQSDYSCGENEAPQTYGQRTNNYNWRVNSWYDDESVESHEHPTDGNSWVDYSLGEDQSVESHEHPTDGSNSFDYSWDEDRSVQTVKSPLDYIDDQFFYISFRNHSKGGRQGKTRFLISRNIQV
jgi:hypothetical protein